MTRHVVVTSLVLLAVAALAQSAAVLAMALLLVVALILSRAWSERVAESIECARTMPARAFINDRVNVGVRLRNRSALPAPWLYVRDGVPVEIGAHAFHQAITLGPHETRDLGYTVHVNRRGRYRIGPLTVQTGDVLGLSGVAKREGRSEWLTVYPKIVQLTQLGLPSRSPLGSLHETQPVFEDPARVRGKRDYAYGDSLRRMDWKTSAASNRWQVRQYEPSIALEAMLFLDLNRSNYDRMTSLDDVELAIVVAASVANWIVAKKEAVGLATNALDPAPADAHPHHSAPLLEPFQALLPRKGRGHFTSLLDVLARAQPAPTDSDFAALIGRERVKLAWGTTLVAITGQLTEALLGELLLAQRSGLNGAVIVCGRNAAGFRQVRRRAAGFGIVAHHVLPQRDWNLQFDS
jgi:uncharacterized protein (DUF58 family)